MEILGFLLAEVAVCLFVICDFLKLLVQDRFAPLLLPLISQYVRDVSSETQSHARVMVLA